jgi:hypothetical protein
VRKRAFGMSAMLLVALFFGAGCVVAPAGQPRAYPPPAATVPPPPPPPMAEAPPPETEVAPPMEYVVSGAPIYYEAFPRVPFYPLYLESCLCVAPVRFVHGAWVDVYGATWHRGAWAYRSVPPHVAARWRANGFVGRNGHNLHPARYHAPAVSRNHFGSPVMRSPAPKKAPPKKDDHKK